MKKVIIIAMLLFVGCTTPNERERAKAKAESEAEVAKIQLQENIQSFIGARIESIDVTSNPVIIVTEGGGIIKLNTGYSVTENNFIPAQSDVRPKNTNQ